MSVFDELLAIKRFREDQAELAMVRQRLAHARTQAELARAEQDLRDYLDWSRQRERGLYADLCRRIVRVREIESVLEDVAGLRHGKLDRENEVENARGELQRQARALAQCRQAHQEATRVTGKFVELAERHWAAHLQALERKEDAELEEAAAVARDREDWEQHEEIELP